MMNPQQPSFTLNTGILFSLALHGVAMIVASMFSPLEVVRPGTSETDLLLSVALVSDNSSSDPSLTESAHSSASRPDSEMAVTPADATRRVAKTDATRRAYSETEAVEPPGHASPPNAQAASQPAMSDRPSHESTGQSRSPAPQEPVATTPATASHSKDSANYEPAGSASTELIRLAPRAASRNGTSEVVPPSPRTADTVLATPTADAPSFAESPRSGRAFSSASLPGGGPSSAASGDYVPARPRTNNPVPDYPNAARRHRLEGRVVLAVAVNEVGHVRSVVVREPSRWRLLDSAARDAVSKWAFVPAKRNGISVESVVILPVVFRL